MEVVNDEDERLLRGLLLQECPRRELRLGGRGADRVGGLDPELDQHLDERPVRDPFAIGEGSAAGDRRLPRDVAEEVGDEPRLADPCRAYECEEAAGPSRDDVGEIGPQTVALSAPPDHRSLELPRDAYGRGVEVDQPMRRDGVGLAFQAELERLGRDRVPHEPQRVVPEEDLPGTRSLFQARGDVHRITSDESAPLAGDDGAGVDADPGLEPQLVHDIAQLYRRARRSQRVVLGRDGNAEHRHHRVADELFHRPPVPFEHDPSRVVVPVHQRTQSLWIGAVADRRRPRQVAEQHRDDLSDLARRSRGQRRSAPGAELEVVGALSSAMRARHHGRESMSLPPHRGTGLDQGCGSADYRQMRWLAPVAVLVGLLVMLAILGLSESLPIGALAIFSAGVLSGRLASRNHVWMAAAGACVAAVLGLIAIGVANRGEDPWWELIAVIVGVLTVSAVAAWCVGVWVGAKMRPHTRADVA